MNKKLLPITILITLMIAGCSKGNSSISSFSSEDITSSSEESSEDSSVSSSNPKDDITVSLNYSEYSLAVSDNFKLIATVDNTEYQSVKWSSSNESIAYVTKYGYVYAFLEGEVTIKATSVANPNKFAICKVTVYAVNATSITLSESNRTIETGETFALSAEVLPENASHKTVEWSVENPEIAKVSPNGDVTGLYVGETHIIATCKYNPTVFAKCHVTVTPIALEGLKLARNKAEIHVDETFTLVTRFTPSNASNKNITYSSNDETIATVSNNGIITGKKAGSAIIKVVSEEGHFEDTFNISVKDKSELIKTTLPYTYSDYMDNNFYSLDATPNDSANLLVVPVWFKDSSNFIKNKSKTRDHIEQAYFGTNEETGWRSVKSYYEELSGYQLSVGGLCTDWLEVSESYTAYGDESAGMSKTVELVQKATDWVKEKYNYSTLANFDADADGFLDGVVLIYGAPDHQALGNSNYDNLWAYTYWVQKDSLNDKMNPGPNVFFWASYDFIYGSSNTLYSKYHNGDTSYCNVDAHTFIHEAGHMFGLEDYYDYGSNGYKAAGGFSMQDYNVGSHDPYSVMSLGWANPYVITDTKTLTIGTFQETKDLILVTPEFHNSSFDEYILIELYSPTGLNKFDTDHTYDGGYPRGANKVGVRLWHVDARLCYGSMSTRNITFDPTHSGGVYHMMNNSSGDRGTSLGKDYQRFNLLELIRNDTSETYNSKNVFDANDLFLAGDSFTISKFNSQFVNDAKLNSGISFPFTISFDSMTANSVTVTITRN